MQGADPAVVLVHLPGDGFPGFRVDDGEAGAGGAHVQQVPGRVVDERPDPVRAHLVRVGIGFQRGAALDVVKAAQIGPEPDGAVPVAGHREDRVVVEGGVVPREHALGLPLAAAGRRPAEQAAAVRGDPQVLAVLIDVRDDGIVLARHPAGAESHVGEAETGFRRHQDAGLVQAQPEVSFGVPEAGSGFPVAGFLPDGRDEGGPDFLRFRVEMEQAAVLVPHEEQALFPRGGLRVEDDGRADGRGRPAPGSLPDEAGTGLEQQQAFRASQQDVARDRVFGHVVDAEQVAGLLQLRAPREPGRRLQGDGVQDDGLAVAREDPQPSGSVQEQGMDVIRVQGPVDGFPFLGKFLPGFTVDDEHARAARAYDQGSGGGNLQEPSDIRIHGRIRVPVQVEVREGGVFGIQDVQAGGRPDPLRAPAVFDHVDDGGAGQAVRALPVVLVGLEPESVEADQSAFRADPYIIGAVLVDPVHLRVGEA